MRFIKETDTFGHIVVWTIYTPYAPTYSSLTKKQFLFIQDNFQASKSFWKIYPLKNSLNNPSNLKMSIMLILF